MSSSSPYSPSYSPAAVAAASLAASMPAPVSESSMVAANPVEIDPDYEALPPTAGPIAHMVAGALAGITEHTVMYPVDAVKTRLQILSPTPQALYSGTMNAFAKISSTEGVRALWRGVSSVVVGAGPAHALYFATYEHFKAWAMEISHAEDERNIHPAWAGAAGATATVVQDAIMNPFDVIKQRMQTFSGHQYTSLVHCARSVLANEGFRAFYVSYPTTLSMSIPFQSIHFAVYEAASAALNPSRHYDPKSHIVAGAAAGALASLVTTPLDVAKTLLQTKGEVSDPAIRNARGMRDALRLVWAREGARGFAKGWAPRVLSHMPATAVCWTTYEYFKFFMSTSAADAAAMA
ncbi:Fe(2+) transporter [Blastocladiella emersonii ATCC 22665]|nr:Fe(2+) transporter [Blastocladiella emersonii ATCC 22665]